VTVITHARRKSRLAKLVESSGGTSVGTALAQARANLDRLRPQGLEEVAARVTEMADIPPPRTVEERNLAMATAYRAANGVIDAAGPFDLPDLCGVAAGLCDLIDAASDQRPMDWRVVPVHAQTLRLLLALPVDAAAARSAVLAELGDMVEKKLAQAG
jgi:hypothetical protein